MGTTKRVVQSSLITHDCHIINQARVAPHQQPQPTNKPRWGFYPQYLATRLGSHVLGEEPSIGTKRATTTYNNCSNNL
eukprot:Gb_12344 [translate_table: standard]